LRHSPLRDGGCRNAATAVTELARAGCRQQRLATSSGFPPARSRWAGCVPTDADAVRAVERDGNLSRARMSRRPRRRRSIQRLVRCHAVPFGPPQCGRLSSVRRLAFCARPRSRSRGRCLWDPSRPLGVHRAGSRHADADAGAGEGPLAEAECHIPMTKCRRPISGRGNRVPP
jgi:hypothetical protein